jgi:hypothetical protein
MKALEAHTPVEEQLNAEITPHESWPSHGAVKIHDLTVSFEE